MMAAPPRSKLVQRIWGCKHVQYSFKVLKIGFVFLGNRFRVKDLLLGTVWEATVTGDLETAPRFSFKTGHCDLEKSDLFFILF